MTGAKQCRIVESGKTLAHFGALWGHSGPG